MKITFVTTRLYMWGGVEVLLLNTIRGLIARGHEIRLVVLLPTESPVFDRLPEGVSVCFGFHGAFTRQTIRAVYAMETKFFPGRLRRLITEGNPDLIISYKEGISTVLLLSGLEIPTLVYVHTIVSDKKPHSIRSRYLEKRYRDALQRITHFIFVSDSCRRAFTNLYRIPEKKQSTLYNYIPLTVIAEKARAFSVPVKTPGVIRFCFAGRLEAEKGILRLLRALARLKGEDYQYELLVCGDGHLEQECRRIIAFNNMEGSVRMLGYCENPYPYIAHSDWYVSPSENEGFGLSVLEAIKLGIKVVCTRAGGTEDIINIAGGGVLIENSENAVYEALRDILEGRLDCPVAHDGGQEFSEKEFFLKLFEILQQTRYGISVG